MSSLIIRNPVSSQPVAAPIHTIHYLCQPKKRQERPAVDVEQNGRSSRPGREAEIIQGNKQSPRWPSMTFAYKSSQVLASTLCNVLYWLKLWCPQLLHLISVLLGDFRGHERAGLNFFGEVLQNSLKGFRIHRPAGPRAIASGWTEIARSEEGNTWQMRRMNQLTSRSSLILFPVTDDHSQVLSTRNSPHWRPSASIFSGTRPQTGQFLNAIGIIAGAGDLVDVANEIQVGWAMSRCHLSTEILTWANEWHNNIHPTLSTTKQKLCQTYAKMTNTCHVVPVSTRNWNHGTDNIRFGMLQLDESNPHIKTAFVSPSSASVWLRHIAPTRLAWMEWPRGGLAQFHMLCALLTYKSSKYTEFMYKNTSQDLSEFSLALNNLTTICINLESIRSKSELLVT